MFAQRLLYLSDAGIAVWWWRRGELSSHKFFPIGAAGVAQFETWLGEDADVPLVFLADVIEEDFRTASLPFIIGRDRAILLQRKLTQTFRNTPYCQGTRQGRATEGRRDEQVLLSALTNEDLLKPWIDKILARKAPLAGIYSVPLITARLVDKLELTGPHVLVVSWQAMTGLRQSYFQNGQLKFSRLTFLSDDDQEKMSEAVGRESRRTQQYLQSLKLLPRDQTIEVCMIRHLAHFPGGENPFGQDTLLHFRLIELQDAAKAIGLKAASGNLGSESLFLHLLATRPPATQYAPPEQIWYNRLRQIRLGLRTASAAVILVGAMVAAADFNEGISHYHQADQVTAQAQGLDRQRQNILRSLPTTTVSPEEMRGVVETVETIQAKATSPEDVLIRISAALDRSPELRIREIRWQASPDKPSDGQTDASRPAPPAETPIQLGSGRQRLYQIAVIEGEATDSHIGFRATLNAIHRFMDILRSNRAFEVTPLTLPLDIDPRSNVKGSASEQPPPRSSFAVRLIVSPAP